jgi:anti-sigma regulatory factor (Ser/Thr protein kinase)
VLKLAIGTEDQISNQSDSVVNASRQSICLCGRPVMQSPVSEGVRGWSGEFVLDNDPAAIPGIVSQLQEKTLILELSEQAVAGVGVAVEEALVNSIQHGNLELSSQLREVDHAAFCDALEQRRGDTPYCQRRVRLQATVCPHEVVLVIRDQGRGFSVTELPDPREESNLHRIGGRGILLMRAYMDEVHYNDVGNEVRLIKRRITQRADFCGPRGG